MLGIPSCPSAGLDLVRPRVSALLSTLPQIAAAGWLSPPPDVNARARRPPSARPGLPVPAHLCDPMAEPDPR